MLLDVAGKRSDGGLKSGKEEHGMPTYDFVCEKCKKAFTLTMKISEYEKKRWGCPKCKSRKVKQQIGSFQTITSKKS
jgi:putative FmdB family regulatory protein